MSKIKFQTPKGELRWTQVNGQGKENLNGEREYTATVVVEPDAAQECIEALDALWEEHKPKGATTPKSMGYKELDDGSVSFVMKTKVTYPNGDQKKIRIYNAKAEQIQLPEDKKIGNGSVGRASGIASIYDAGKAARGVTLYLDAIQLIKFVEYTGSDNFEEDEGFEGFGDAFTAEELD